jgi:hypothetical protein
VAEHSKRPRGSKPPQRDRTTITLPPFQLFELHGLIGIYGKTVTQVVESIVGEWLSTNQQNIEIRRKRHMEYLAGKESRE